jgi:hypothetical protein
MLRRKIKNSHHLTVLFERAKYTILGCLYKIHLSHTVLPVSPNDNPFIRCANWNHDEANRQNVGKKGGGRGEKMLTSEQNRTKEKGRRSF